MVLHYLEQLLADRFGCDGEDVVMGATLDELNLTLHDLEEIALCLDDVYGVEIPASEWMTFETVEDLVGYVEDRL